jgi:hypothetical protein
MKVEFDPSVERSHKQAYLYEGDQLIGAAWHEAWPDGEGGWRPIEDVRFEIDCDCEPTHAVVCGRTLLFRTRKHLEPGDCYTLEQIVNVAAFGAPFRDGELK